MTKTLEGFEGRLERVTTQLEQAAKRNQGGGFGGALKPFVLGTLVGAGLALLYAPQPGEQTRAVLQRNANDLQERATQAASSVKEQLPEPAAAQGKMRALLDQAKQQGKTAAGQGKETTQSAEAEADGKLGTDAATVSTTKERVVGGSQAEKAQAQLRRDLQSGSENLA